jgi:Rps23 Pro-64 3,4-dihydroxylase Tpa1-like proline 4-hydroxylase
MNQNRLDHGTLFRDSFNLNKLLAYNVQDENCICLNKLPTDFHKLTSFLDHMAVESSCRWRIFVCDSVRSELLLISNRFLCIRISFICKKVGVCMYLTEIVSQISEHLMLMNLMNLMPSPFILSMSC